MMRTVRLPDGDGGAGARPGHLAHGRARPRGEGRGRGAEAGIELGMTLIDTAEMYGNGGAEEVVGEASRGSATRCSSSARSIRITPRAAARRRLRAQPEAAVDRPDRPLPAALARQPPAGRDRGGVRGAAEEGKIRHWGVSNFDARDMQGLVRLPGGAQCAANQVLYHPAAAASSATVAWCTEHNIPLMAYSPVGQGGRLLHRRPRRRGEAPRCDAGADRHRLEHAARQRHHHPEGQRSRARARERRRWRDRPERR